VQLKVCPITVVNIKYCPDFNPDKNPNDVYIGRFHQSAKYGALPASKWANPFWITDDVNRETVIELYRDYIVNNPGLMNSLLELDGKRLGCWCKPELCHGDILAKLSESEQGI